MKAKIIHMCVGDISLLLADLQDAQQHLISDEYITAIGAIAAAPEILHRILGRLTVLRDVEANPQDYSLPDLKSR